MDMLETKSGNVSMAIKILLPAGIALTMAVAGASWTRGIASEHRLTVVEGASIYQGQAIDNIQRRQESIEAKLDRATESLNRIEGTLGTKLLMQPAQ